MRRIAGVLLIFGFCVLPAAVALAQPFPITDVRALGMGGAFVAAGEGIGAVQYNPALLDKDSTMGVVLPEAVTRIEDHMGLGDLLSDLDDASSTADTTQMISILHKLDQGGSLDVQASASAGVGFDLFGIAAGVTYSRSIYGMAMPSAIDTSVAVILDPGSYPDSNVLRYGAVDAQEIILSGAKSFGDMAIGANVRNINATLYADQMSLFGDPDTGFSDLTEGSSTDESTTAIDVGFFMNLAPTIDIGIVGRDVNSPELGDVEFDPRYRVGASLNLPMITVAADYDFGENSVENSTEYQEWAVGAELDIWAIALRGGLSQNTALSGSPTLIHLGLGLGFLDLGAAYAEDGDYYMAGLNLALGF